MQRLNTQLGGFKYTGRRDTGETDQKSEKVGERGIQFLKNFLTGLSFGYSLLHAKGTTVDHTDVLTGCHNI